MIEIIKTIEDFDEYVSVSGSTSLEKLKPAIESAYSTYLIPALGDQLLLTLERSENEFIVGHLKKSLVNFAVGIHLPYLQVEIDGNGISQNREKALFQRTEDNLKNSLFETAFKALEELTDFFEENIGDHPAYLLSPEREMKKDLFVKSSSVFQGFSSINNSSQTFRALMPIIAKVQRQWLQKILGVDLYESLMLFVLGGNAPVSYNLILPHIQAALVYETVAKATKELNVQLDSSGALTLSFKSNSHNNKERQVQLIQLKGKEEENTLSAKGEIQLLTEKLIKYKTDFPQFTGSPLDVESGSGFTNNSESKIFYL